MRNRVTAFLLLAVVLASISGLESKAAEIKWKEKKVKVKDLTTFPSLPEDPTEVGEKDVLKARGRVYIEHSGYIQAEVFGAFGHRYMVGIQLINWDMTITAKMDEINNKMLSPEVAQSEINKVIEGFDENVQGFYLDMWFPESRIYGVDADINNWNVVFLDGKGTPHDPVKIETLYKGRYIHPDYPDYYFLFHQYYLTADSSIFASDKIEVVVAGGQYVRRKLGFRWVFK